MILATALALSSCIASDGDTIACQGVRYRLLAVSAADKTTSSPCRQKRPGFICDDRLYVRDKATMARFIRRGKLTWEPLSYDGRNRRSVGILRAGGRSANCHMLRRGAVYAVKYDRAVGFPVARECGLK